MNLITCNFDPETKPSEFDPFPGSDKAVKLGCTCPEQKWWPGQLRFAVDCPVHELEKAPH